MPNYFHSLDSTRSQNLSKVSICCLLQTVIGTCISLPSADCSFDAITRCSGCRARNRSQTRSGLVQDQERAQTVDTALALDEDIGKAIHDHVKLVNKAIKFTYVHLMPYE
jgi:hypothetical protein